MICQWDAYLSVLPDWMRRDVDKLGRSRLTELRLRLGHPPKLVMRNQSVSIPGKVTRDDLNTVINNASRFSPWTADSISRGYLTGPGGHRIGVCGQVFRQSGEIAGIREPSMLCIRVAKDFPGLAAGLKDIAGSVLIIGPPGSGKTTMLRDLIRQKSSLEQGSIAVVDDRGELFPSIKNTWSYPIGSNTDVLTGSTKQEGIEMVLRTMGPRWIAVDEISSEEDCSALYRAGWCGVTLLATAHAENKRELLTRPVYKPITAHKLFDIIICMNRDQTWRMEEL